MLYFKKARSGAPSGILEQGSGTQCRKERHSAAFLSPRALYFLRTVCYGITVHGLPTIFKAIPHNSKCRYGERGATAAKPKAQIILDAAKVSAASGGNSEPKQGQRSQSARGFCPRSTMRVPQPDIIEHFGNADAVPQLPERCLSRKAGIVRCCLMFFMGGISICSILPLLPSTPKSALNFFSIRNHGVWHCFVPLQPAYT